MVLASGLALKSYAAPPRSTKPAPRRITMSVLRLVPMSLPRAKLAEPLPTTNGGVPRTLQDYGSANFLRAIVTPPLRPVLN